MEKLKESKASDGQLIHYSVGCLIEKEGKYFLIDRAMKPYGFAFVAGHVDSGESVENALIREVKEEVGLDVVDFKLIHECELKDNFCIKGASTHHWYVFRCDVSGDVKINPKEVKSFGWYSKKEIKNLKLEDSWNRLLKLMKII